MQSVLASFFASLKCTAKREFSRDCVIEGEKKSKMSILSLRF
jgi:hypothetical protein